VLSALAQDGWDRWRALSSRARARDDTPGAELLDLGGRGVQHGAAMKISIARMIANLAARGRALGNRFAWWSRWFPPATTVDPDRFQGDGDPYPDHWREFPRPWPAGQAVEPEALKTALAALPDPWRRVVILRDVDARPPAEVSAATGLTAEQQREVLNRARALLVEKLGDALKPDPGGS
jgi:RNA polymerase sigma-70 factor, ECF subfamily